MLVIAPVYAVLYIAFTLRKQPLNGAVTFEAWGTRLSHVTAELFPRHSQAPSLGCHPDLLAQSGP